MPTQQPLFGAADFFVFEPLSAQFVSASVPFSRVNVLLGIIGPDMLITMSVKTGYSDNLRAARVLLNGKQIGSVDPRPWVNHYLIDMETITFVVPPSARPPELDPIGHLAVATLQVIPTNADPDNWLFVGSVVCHYHKQGTTMFP
jgi:hypothetical protein